MRMPIEMPILLGYHSDEPLKGVVAVGPGTSEVKMEVKVGDEVLYGKYAGTEINVDGTDYLIMKQSDILATL